MYCLIFKASDEFRESPSILPESPEVVKFAYICMYMLWEVHNLAYTYLAEVPKYTCIPRTVFPWVTAWRDGWLLTEIVLIQSNVAMISNVNSAYPPPPGGFKWKCGGEFIYLMSAEWDICKTPAKFIRDKFLCKIQGDQDSWAKTWINSVM